MIRIEILSRTYAIAWPFLLLAAVVLPLFRARRRSPFTRAALALLCLIAVLVPVNGLPVFGFIRSLVWELSVTSSILLACVVLRQLTNRRPVSAGDLSPIFFLVGAAGLVFYLSVVGLLRVDVYRLGYRPLGLLLALLALAVAAWALRRRAAALFILIAVAAFDVRLLVSDNLWDYLIDPPLTIFAWGWAAGVLAVRLRRRSASGGTVERA